MCYKMCEGTIYVYHEKDRLIYQSMGAVLKTKCHMTQSYNIPLSENMIHGKTIYWGYMQQHIMIAMSMDSLGQEFLNLLDQASWCHAGMARSSWLHSCGRDVTGISARAFFWAAGMAGTAGTCFIWVASGAGAADVGCMCGAGGVMQVVPLRSGVLSEPAVWQLCHLGQCRLFWHCIHRGVSMHGGMWNHCWCVLDSSFCGRMHITVVGTQIFWRVLYVATG